MTRQLDLPAITITNEDLAVLSGVVQRAMMDGNFAAASRLANEMHRARVVSAADDDADDLLLGGDGLPESPLLPSKRRERDGGREVRGALDGLEIPHGSGQGLRGASSLRIDQLRDGRITAGRDRHNALLENHSTAEVANLVAYLQSAR